MTFSRRTFLSRAAVAVGAFDPAPGAPAAIDTHTHFYDIARTEGVPWPPKSEPVLYRTHLPPEFQVLSEPHNVAGTVIVEASPWVEDNQWILDLAADYPFVVGFIGNLEAGKPEFAANLRRFARNPLFRGLRLGARAIAGGMGQRPFEDDLRRMADARLTLDVVGGSAMLSDVRRVAALAPKLRMVIDHLPFEEWDGKPEVMRQGLAPIARLPNVYIKISNVVRRREGGVIEDPAFYRPGLDVLWELFGADRLVFGSNWPVSNRIAPYATLHGIVAGYFRAKGPLAAEKYFRNNSKAAYRWITRQRQTA
ncbi:MAG: amidohydrolase family protein [Blastocatellia bacterium]